MRVKSGVQLSGTQFEMRDACLCYGAEMRSLGGQPEITSGSEGAHGDGSYHFYGYALDFSIKGLTLGEQRSIVASMRIFLSSFYDVVLEDDHIHVEFDVTRAKLAGYKKEF